jgi:hypothetical protein
VSPKQKNGFNGVLGKWEFPPTLHLNHYRMGVAILLGVELKDARARKGLKDKVHSILRNLIFIHGFLGAFPVPLHAPHLGLPLWS